MSEQEGAFDRRAQELASKFDRLCQAALGGPGLDGVYVSPLWETYTSTGPGRSRAWKRSVLRRIPGAGAEPWGHLFLVVASAGLSDPTVALSEEGLPAGTADPSAVSATIQLDPGPPSAWVLLRPRGPTTASPLREFAETVHRRWSEP